DLGLGDAVEVVFDGVLDGGDIHRVLVELAEGRVEGGGLTRAGGAGDQHDAVGRIDDLLPEGPRVLVEAAGPAFDVDGPGVEDTENGRLEGAAAGDGGPARAEPAGLAGAADAARPGGAAFGAGQVRHALEAAGDGRGHGGRRVHHREGFAVAAEADLECL